MAARGITQDMGHGGRAGRRMARGTAASDATCRLNLALQGGGAHGAFTWGVLDRLLEDEGVAFEGVSGTSAGALNAVALASGWLAGGAAAARHALATLWREVAGLARFSPLRAGGMTQMAADFTAQLLSPYQLNPLGLNPLRQILDRAGRFRAPARVPRASRCSLRRPTCAAAQRASSATAS